MHGWTEKILDIDLTSGQIETIPLDREVGAAWAPACYGIW